MTQLIGLYGEGTLSLVSPDCVHSPTQRPSPQAAVPQPAAHAPAPFPDSSPGHTDTVASRPPSPRAGAIAERHRERGGRGPGLLPERD